VSETVRSLLPLLVQIQTQLSADLSLAALSRLAGWSPAHLQRTFRAAIGESPKEYVARLRLERAAFRLLVYDDTVIEIALDCGYDNHETFTRAFRRRFGVAPSEYRRAVRGRGASHGDPDMQQAAHAFSLSETKVCRLRPTALAFVRHVGAYEDVPESIFDAIDAWATQQRVGEPRIWMGLGHDAPSTTAADKLRFDAALAVDTDFDSTGAIGCQWFAGGEFAVTTHVGPYSTLADAYAAIFPRVIALPKYQLIGLPAVELYRTSRINTRLALNVTDICLPVARS
jgi:AraC family transcriptional regulator